MEIRFGTSDLARICNSAASLDRRWGKPIGAAIRERLCLLAGTPTLELLSEFSGLLMAPVNLDKQGRFAIAVVSECSLVVRPDHEPIPLVRSRQLDCTKVKKLVIEEVNGHGH
jgi:hypothetical protein